MTIPITENNEANMGAVLKAYGFQEKIFAERINFLYKNLLLSVPASFLGAMFVFVALHHIAHDELLKNLVQRSLGSR